MVSWSAGSVTDYVVKIVSASKIPSSLSGTNLTDVINMQLDYVQQYTGVIISSTDIPQKYQGPIANLSIAQVLRAIEVQEGGVQSVSLGELSVNEGGGGGNAETADKLTELARQQLKELGRNIRVYKVWGA